VTMFAVAARWVAKPGEEAEVERCLRELTEATRAEAGCRFYQATRGVGEQSRVFFLFELYDDRAAAEAHWASPHFERIARGDGIPRLEKRERWYYETIGE
jgi:quinol monooxygenase YgiN